MHIRNFLALGSGEAVSRVIAFGAFVFIARVLGAEGYGIVAFAASVTLYLSKFADFAIETVGAGEIAKDPKSVESLGAAMFGARTVWAMTLILISTAFVQLTAPEPDRTALTLYFLTLAPVALSTKWIHMGLNRSLSIGLWRIVGESVFLLVVVLFVRNVGDIWIVPVAVLAGDSLTNLALYIKLRQDGQRFGFRWDPDVALPLFRKAAPVLAQLMLALLLYNLDFFFIRLILDAESMGYYAAAYALISFLGNIGSMYGMSIIPALAHHGEASFSEKTLYQTACVEVFTVTVPIAVGGTFAARNMITIAFGEAYLASVPVLQVLFWVIPLAVMRNVPWAALIARNDSLPLLRATTVGVVVNAVLNFVLINIIGLAGAAIATVTTEPFVVGLMLRHAARSGLPVTPLRRFWPPLMAASLMAIALAALGDTNLHYQLAVGGAVYFLGLLLAGSIRFRDGVPVLQL